MAQIKLEVQTYNTLYKLWLGQCLLRNSADFQNPVFIWIGS